MPNFFVQEHNIKIYHRELNAEQKRENDFFGSSKSMCSVNELYRQIFWKVRSVWLLEEMINRYRLTFHGNVLEIGGGYGIQAGYLKAKYGDQITLYYSDVSLNALKKAGVLNNSLG